MDQYLEANRALWDEWTGINYRSDFYKVEALFYTTFPTTWTGPPTSSTPRAVSSAGCQTWIAGRK